jgi:hypothetical protein
VVALDHRDGPGEREIRMPGAVDGDEHVEKPVWAPGHGPQRYLQDSCRGTAARTRSGHGEDPDAPARRARPRAAMPRYAATARSGSGALAGVNS